MQYPLSTYVLFEAIIVTSVPALSYFAVIRT